jgi:hypothetical protein
LLGGAGFLSRRCTAGAMSLSRAAKEGLNGRGGEALPAKELAKLERELADRDQVIGKLTIANRILKNLSRGGPLLEAEKLWRIRYS